jgi:hypothetical protein
VAKSANLIMGKLPDAGNLFGAVDGSAHHVQGKVGETRFAALLSPFRSEADALAALKAAGATVIGGAP